MIALLVLVADLSHAAEPSPTAKQRVGTRTQYLRAPAVADPAATATFQVELHRRFTAMPPPEYPYDARRTRVHGTGRYRIVVDAAGKVTAVSVLTSTGHRELDWEVLKAFRNWRAKAGPPLVVELPVTFAIVSAAGADESFRDEHRLFTPGPLVAPGNR